MNIHVHIFYIWIDVFFLFFFDIYLGVELLGPTVIMINLLKTLQTVSQSNCIILYTYNLSPFESLISHVCFEKKNCGFASICPFMSVRGNGQEVSLSKKSTKRKPTLSHTKSTETLIFCRFFC